MKIIHGISLLIFNCSDRVLVIRCLIFLYCLFNFKICLVNLILDISNKYNIYRDKLPKQKYLEILYNSKIALSPYGMGEVCFRDFELMQFGTLMLKPDMSNIITTPNPYIENQTYIPIELDWSNLNEKVEEILGNYNDFHYIIENFRNKFREVYTYHDICMHWYNILKTVRSVTYE